MEENPAKAGDGPIVLFVVDVAVKRDVARDRRYMDRAQSYVHRVATVVERILTVHAAGLDSGASAGEERQPSAHVSSSPSVSALWAYQFAGRRQAQPPTLQPIGSKSVRQFAAVMLDILQRAELPTVSTCNAIGTALHPLLQAGLNHRHGNDLHAAARLERASVYVFSPVPKTMSALRALVPPVPASMDHPEDKTALPATSNSWSATGNADSNRRDEQWARCCDMVDPETSYLRWIDSGMHLSEHADPMWQEVLRDFDEWRRTSGFGAEPVLTLYSLLADRSITPVAYRARYFKPRTNRHFTEQRLLAHQVEDSARNWTAFDVVAGSDVVAQVELSHGTAGATDSGCTLLHGNLTLQQDACGTLVCRGVIPRKDVQASGLLLSPEDARFALLRSRIETGAGNPANTGSDTGGMLAGVLLQLALQEVDLLADAVCEPETHGRGSTRIPCLVSPLTPMVARVERINCTVADRLFPAEDHSHSNYTTHRSNTASEPLSEPVMKRNDECSFCHNENVFFAPFHYGRRVASSVKDSESTAHCDARIAAQAAKSDPTVVAQLFEPWCVAGNAVDAAAATVLGNIASRLGKAVSLEHLADSETPQAASSVDGAVLGCHPSSQKICPPCRGCETRVEPASQNIGRNPPDPSEHTDKVPDFTRSVSGSPLRFASATDNVDEICSRGEATAPNGIARESRTDHSSGLLLLGVTARKRARTNRKICEEGDVRTQRCADPGVLVEITAPSAPSPADVPEGGEPRSRSQELALEHCCGIIDDDENYARGRVSLVAHRAFSTLARVSRDLPEDAEEKLALNSVVKRYRTSVRSVRAQVGEAEDYMMDGIHHDTHAPPNILVPLQKALLRALFAGYMHLLSSALKTSKRRTPAEAVKDTTRILAQATAVCEKTSRTHPAISAFYDRALDEYFQLLFRSTRQREGLNKLTAAVCEEYDRDPVTGAKLSLGQSPAKQHLVEESNRSRYGRPSPGGVGPSRLTTSREISPRRASQLIANRPRPDAIARSEKRAEVASASTASMVTLRSKRVRASPTRRLEASQVYSARFRDSMHRRLPRDVPVEHYMTSSVQSTATATHSVLDHKSHAEESCDEVPDDSSALGVKRDREDDVPDSDVEQSLPRSCRPRLEHVGEYDD